MPKLIITLKECSGLKKADLLGLSDPYVIFRYVDEERKSTVKKNTLDPKYNEVFKYVLRDLSNPLEIDVWDWNGFSKDQLIGNTILKLDKIERNDEMEFTLKLKPKGTICLEVLLTDKSCEHVIYQKCEVMGVCCNLYFGCAKCHNNYYKNLKGEEKHPPFSKIRQVRCMNCFMEQPFREDCCSCDSVFCKYSCSRCNEFYNRPMKHCYICNDCVDKPKKHEHFPFICSKSKLYEYIREVDMKILDGENYEEFLDKFPLIERNIDLIGVFFRQTLIRAVISQCFMVERVIRDADDEAMSKYDFQVSDILSKMMRIKVECEKLIKTNKNVRRRDLYFMKIRVLMKVKMINSFKKYTIKHTVMPKLKISSGSIRREISSRKTGGASTDPSQTFNQSLSWDGYTGSFVRECQDREKEVYSEIQGYLRKLRDANSTDDYHQGKLRKKMNKILVDDYGKYFKSGFGVKRDSFFDRKDVQFVALLLQVFLEKEFTNFHEIQTGLDKKKKRLKKFMACIASIYEDYKVKMLEEEERRLQEIEEEKKRQKELEKMKKKKSSNKLLKKLSIKKKKKKKDKNKKKELLKKKKSSKKDEMKKGKKNKNKKKELLKKKKKKSSKKDDLKKGKKKKKKKKKSGLKHNVSSFMKRHGLPHRLTPKKKKKKKSDEDSEEEEEQEEEDDATSEDSEVEEEEDDSEEEEKEKEEEDDDDDDNDESSDEDDDGSKKKKKKQKKEEKKKTRKESKKNLKTPKKSKQQQSSSSSSPPLITPEKQKIIGASTLPATPSQIFSVGEDEEITSDETSDEHDDDDDDDDENSDDDEQSSSSKSKKKSKSSTPKKIKITQHFQLDIVDLYLILSRIFVCNFRTNKAFLECMYSIMTDFRSNVVKHQEPKYTHIIGLKELADSIFYRFHDPLVHLFRTSFDNIEIIFKILHIFEKAIYARIIPKAGKKKPSAGVRKFIRGIVKNLKLFEFMVQQEHEERKLEKVSEVERKSEFDDDDDDGDNDNEGKEEEEEEEKERKDRRFKETMKQIKVEDNRDGWANLSYSSSIKRIRKSCDDEGEVISAKDFPAFSSQAMFMFEQVKAYSDQLTKDEDGGVTVVKLFKKYFKVKFAKMFAKGFVKPFLSYVDLFFRSLQKHRHLAELGLFQTIVPLLIDLNKYVDFGENSNFYEILGPPIKHALSVNLAEKLQGWAERAVAMEDFKPIDPEGDVMHSSFCKDVIEFVFHPIEIIYTIDVLSREGDRVQKSFMFDYFPVMADTLTSYAVDLQELIEDELKRNLQYQHTQEKKKDQSRRPLFALAKEFGSGGEESFRSVGVRSIAEACKGVDVRKLCLLSSNIQGMLDYLINVFLEEEFEDVLFNSLYLDLKQEKESRRDNDDNDYESDDDEAIAYDGEVSGESEEEVDSDDDDDSDTDENKRRKRSRPAQQKLSFEEKQKQQKEFEEIPKNIFEVPEIKRLIKELTGIRDEVARLFAEFVYLENLSVFRRLLVAENPDNLMKEFQGSVNERLSLLSSLMYYEIFNTVIRSLFVILVNECVECVFLGSRELKNEAKKKDKSWNFPIANFLFGESGGGKLNQKMEDTLVKNVRFFIHTISMVFRSGGLKREFIMNHTDRLNGVLQLQNNNTKELMAIYESSKEVDDRRRSFYALKMLNKKGSKREKKFVKSILPEKEKALSFKKLVKEQFSRSKIAVSTGKGKGGAGGGEKKLFVFLKNGIGLKAVDRKRRSSDPYVIIRFGKKQKKFSDVKYKRVNPVWNQEFVFDYLEYEFQTAYNRGGGPEIKILFKVNDRDKWKRDDFIGQVWADLSDLEDDKKITKTLKLEMRKGSPKKGGNKVKKREKVIQKIKSVGTKIRKKIRDEKEEEEVEGESDDDDDNEEENDKKEEKEEEEEEDEDDDEGVIIVEFLLTALQ